MWNIINIIKDNNRVCLKTFWNNVKYYWYIKYRICLKTFWNIDDIMYNMDSFDMEALNRQFFESAAFSEFQAGVVLEPVGGGDSSPTHHDQENTVST